MYALTPHPADVQSRRGSPDCRLPRLRAWSAASREHIGLWVSLAVIVVMVFALVIVVPLATWMGITPATPGAAVTATPQASASR